MNGAAPPYSPPVENPWIRRSTMRNAGAQNPTLSKEGIRPTASVAPDISNIVSASTDFRPNRSPSGPQNRSEEHTSELQSLMRISYAVFCLKKKTNNKYENTTITQ